MWWHHVKALDPVNVLLNYWWDLTGETWKGSPFKALMHAIMSVRDLPERERQIWRTWFKHYVIGRDTKLSRTCLATNAAHLVR